MASGAPIIDYGVVNFVRNRREAKADFVRVNHDIDVKMLLKFMVRQWRLTEPGIIVQVTGSAQDFDLPAKYVPPITEGIVYAASKANAWVISGGMDAGVMSLIGSSIARHHHKCHKTPVIGVGSWRGVQNSQMLENACGERVEYYSQGANTREAAGLEPNHTQCAAAFHFLPLSSAPVVRLCSRTASGFSPCRFLLVDKLAGGRSGNFGAELEVLDELQRQLKEQFSAPTVLLVIIMW